MLGGTYGFDHWDNAIQICDYATIATIFIAISAIGCAGDGQGIKAIPSSNSNPIVRQGVPIPQTPQSGQPSTLNALPDATVVMEQPAGSRLVVYRSGSFSPDRLDVGPGDIVAFVNESDSARWAASNIHPTHEILLEFDAGKLVAPGGFWLFEFVDSGFWRYHNHLLFSSSGLVVVSGSGAI